MDPTLFRSSLADLVDLRAKEGPNYNVLEPKYEARRQMLRLMETIVNVYATGKSWLAVRQLCQCLTFVGTVLMEVDDDEEGLLQIRKAYALLQLCTAESDDSLPADLTAVTPATLDDIISAEHHFLQRDLKYVGCVEFITVHNATGMYLSRQDTEVRVNNAKKVLHRGEAAYQEWNAWFSKIPGAPAIADLPVGDNGRLEEDKLDAVAADRELCVLRFEMETAYTSTLFFLAQVYAALRDSSLASRYCHLVMVHQLLCKQEFDRKVWAGNALQLSGFYSSHFAYGKALHCLQVGEKVMPSENPDETTAGLVAWAYARFHVHRLTHYGEVLNNVVPSGPQMEDFDSYWVDFPVKEIEPASEMPAISTYNDARETFKAGSKALQEALSFNPFETSCTAHIEIQQDMCKLYVALDLFETDRNRRIAFVQRRIGLLEKFPEELSFNAYPIVVRQLLYDLGFLYEDMIRLRQEQRRKPMAGEKPLKDKPFNSLVNLAKDYYTRFIETWRSPTTQEIPAVLDEDSRQPFFRALMRLAHLEMCYAYGTPKDEYDGIASAITTYQRAIDFAEGNKPFANDVVEVIDKEISLAKDMVKLLPNKQREVWIAYQRSLQQ